MSFFGQYPYHTQQRRSHPVHPHPYAGNFLNLFGGDYPQETPSAYHPHPHSQTPTSIPFQAPGLSIDDEERAALAHLRSIQRRKEVERIIREEAERERAIAELQVQREREAAIIARVKHEREVAAARARAEKEREYIQLLAQLQHQEEQRKIAIANERKKQAQAHARQIQYQQQQQQQQQQRKALLSAAAHAQQQENDERRRQCMRQCGARRSTPSATPKEQQAASGSVDDGLESLNKLIGSLFGIQFDTETKEEKKTEVPSPAPQAEKKESAPVDPTKTSAPADEKTNEKTNKTEAEFPDAINHLLSNYLGLRVEPESKLGQAVSSKVPEGLNELLGQFGLEFVPDATKSEEAGASTENKQPPVEAPKEKKVEPATASTPATPAKEAGSRHPFDLSEFLSGQNGLPPFVRDILGNVELAFKEQQESKKDKGKGVAEGEKKAKAQSAPTEPAPGPTTDSAPISSAATPSATAPVSAPAHTVVENDEVDPKKASSESISKLESIESEIHLTRDSFTFPSTLSFAHTSNNVDAAPSLLFNKQNKPYHAQNNKLLQLLLQADGVTSNGDREVRRKRKQVVKLVEAELESLERKRDQIWTGVKDRRERNGDSSDDESAGSWTTGSTVDHEEVPVHVENVAAEALESTPTAIDQAAEKPEIASFADAVKSTTEPTEAVATDDAPSETPIKSSEVASTEEKVETKKDREEGYELL